MLLQKLGEAETNYTNYKCDRCGKVGKYLLHNEGCCSLTNCARMYPPGDHNDVIDSWQHYCPQCYEEIKLFIKMVFFK